MHWSVIGLVLLFSNHFLPSGMAYRWYQNFPAFYFLLFMEGLALVPLVLFQFGGSPKAAPLILRITICFFLSTTIATFLGEFDQIRWTFFSDITLTSVSTLLRLLSFHSWSDSARYLLTLGTFQVRVYEACSGMEGMALFVILFGLFCFAHRERLRFPRILLLFPIGALTIGACNILRITSLVLIGAKFSPEVAMSGFHSYSGWILFNVVSLAVILIALRSPFFSRGPHRFVSLEDNELVPYLLPFLTLLAMQFLCGAFVSTLDYLYPVRVIGAGTALWMLRGNYRWPRETEIPWAALGIGGVTAAIWLLLEPVRNGTGLPPWDALNPAARYGWLFFRLVGSVVTVPIAEELAFRGFLLRRIIDADFTRVPIGKLTPISLLGSSLIFGSLHSRPMAGFFAGLLFAYALRVRGRLTDAVIAHMTANAVISVVALVSGHWEIWS
jgi:exosortase E/protease (VPEID-CTERM system)